MIKAEKVLAFGEELHGKVRTKLYERLEASRRKRGESHARWARNEEIFRLYSKVEKQKKIREDDGEAGDNPYKYETIVVPYSYAILMTMHTYLCTVFFSRDPIHQLASYHIDEGIGPTAMEALLQYQMVAGSNKIPYFIWVLDQLKYGEGWLGTYWEKKIIQCSSFIEEAEVKSGIKTGRITQRFETKRLTEYEGNKNFNIRPTDMFPDHRVSLANFQEGEFCIRETTLSMQDLKQGEAEGIYFNVKEALESRIQKDKDKLFKDEKLPETQLHLPSQKDSEVYIAHECFVKLSPKAWGIADHGGYEIWKITMVNEGVIIEARPTGDYHGQFPFDLALSEFNVYELAAQSPLDTLSGLNEALNWLMNSHMFNVRKVMNDSMIYDPSRINERDFLKNRAGRMARLRPMAYGTDPRLAVHQFQVFDVTKGHVNDMEMVMNFMQKAMGVNDNLMGAINPGGRKTATEIRTSSTSSANRMQVLAEFMSVMSMAPHAQKLVANNQQYYSDEQNLRHAGSLLNPTYEGKGVSVTPESIAGKFHYIPVDGTLPIDRFLQANMYKEIFSTALQIPQMQMRYDLPRMFAYAMTLSGIKNMAQFELTPDEAAKQQAQAGNIVPTE